MLFSVSVAAAVAPNGRRESSAKKTTSAKQESSSSSSSSSALYTTEFVPNFNSRKISISSWLFSSSFMCHPPAPPPPPPPSASAPPAAVTQPEPQTTKTPTDGRRTRCGRTDGRSRLVEEAQKTLSWPAGPPTDRPTLGSAYYDVKQGSCKIGRVGSDSRS